MRTFDWSLFELYNEGADLLRRGDPQRRLGQRAAPEHQAEEQARRAQGDRLRRPRAQSGDPAGRARGAQEGGAAPRRGKGASREATPLLRLPVELRRRRATPPVPALARGRLFADDRGMSPRSSGQSSRRLPAHVRRARPGRAGARARPAGAPRRPRPAAREHAGRVRERDPHGRDDARARHRHHRRRRRRDLARAGALSGHRARRRRPLAEGAGPADPLADAGRGPALRRRPPQSRVRLRQAVRGAAGRSTASASRRWRRCSRWSSSSARTTCSSTSRPRSSRTARTTRSRPKCSSTRCSP